jgi:hypothetical protein
MKKKRETSNELQAKPWHLRALSSLHCRPTQTSGFLTIQHAPLLSPHMQGKTEKNKRVCAGLASPQTKPFPLLAIYGLQHPKHRFLLLLLPLPFLLGLKLSCEHSEFHCSADKPPSLCALSALHAAEVPVNFQPPSKTLGRMENKKRIPGGN